MGWETVAALWGAILSTWLAVAKYLETRPLVTFEAVAYESRGYEVVFHLTVRNPSRYPLHLISFDSVWPRDALKNQVMSGWETIDIVRFERDRRMTAFIGPGETREIEFKLDGDFHRHLILLVRWSLHRPIILPGVPVPIVRTAKQIAAIRTESVKIRSIGR